MILYLVRHGIAIERGEPGCPGESERFLTPEGKKRAREAAEGIRALGVRPEVIFSSPLVRAAQTAHIYADELRIKKSIIRETDALVPGAQPAALFMELTRSGAESVMCFGHAPNLDLVIAAVLGTERAVTSLKKAGAACLELRSLDPPEGCLRWLLTPRALRALAGAANDA